MLHRTSMTVKRSCLVGAAVLAAGLVCAVLSCDGIGASVNSDGSPYVGTTGTPTPAATTLRLLPGTTATAAARRTR